MTDYVRVGEVAWVDEAGVFVTGIGPGGHLGVSGFISVVDGVAGMTGDCEYCARTCQCLGKPYYTPPATMPETMP